MFPLKPAVKVVVALVAFVGIIVTGEILREKQKQHLKDADSTDDKGPIKDTEDSPIKLKLVAGQVQDIRGLRGNEKQNKTAKDYGTSVATVSKIQLGKAYKDVPNPDGSLFVSPVTKKSTK